MFIKFDSRGVSVEVINSDFVESPEGYVEYFGEGTKFKLVDGAVIPFTEDDFLAELEELRLIREAAAKKYTGILYLLNGIEYLVPLTVDDQNTVTAVSVAVMANAITNTVVEFSNGTSMPIAATEWMAFAAWFAGERNKLFVGA